MSNLYGPSKFETRILLKYHQIFHILVANVADKTLKPILRFILENHSKWTVLVYSSWGVKPFKFDECGGTFTQKASLNVHITSIHEGKEINMCGKGFSCKSTMKKHIHSVHEGKKPHGCPICGKTFYKKVKLKEHIENINLYYYKDT